MQTESYMGLYLERNMAASAEICNQILVVTLRDGRIVHTPLTWFRWLIEASETDRADFEVIGSSIFWNKLDEGISMEPVLLGRYGT
ncbi:MAG: DUF2442 domain-containing protein [Chloroflexota bacterium]|nr:DUF2442 domain-containing protein [Chloroflexota bacterium]